METRHEIELYFPEGEYWQWVEVYPGNVVTQFDSNGVSRHFDDIDQDSLIKIVMMHRDPYKNITIPLLEGMRLIHFYRVQKTLSPEGNTTTRYPVVGYQVTKNNINFKVMMLLVDDGQIIFIDS